MHADNDLNWSTLYILNEEFLFQGQWGVFRSVDSSFITKSALNDSIGANLGVHGPDQRDPEPNPACIKLYFELGFKFVSCILAYFPTPY